MAARLLAACVFLCELAVLLGGPWTGEAACGSGGFLTLLWNRPFQVPAAIITPISGLRGLRSAGLMGWLTDYKPPSSRGTGGLAGALSRLSWPRTVTEGAPLLLGAHLPVSFLGPCVQEPSYAEVIVSLGSSDGQGLHWLPVEAGVRRLSVEGTRGGLCWASGIRPSRASAGAPAARRGGWVPGACSRRALPFVPQLPWASCGARTLCFILWESGTVRPGPRG